MELLTRDEEIEKLTKRIAELENIIDIRASELRIIKDEIETERGEIWQYCRDYKQKLDEAKEYIVELLRQLADKEEEIKRFYVKCR